MNEGAYLGTSFGYKELKEKVTGRAVYAGDLTLPGMLVGGALRSPHPHALIKNIDPSAALAVPGVKGVIIGKDVDPLPYGQVIKDQLPLARERVRYVGEEVAAVAAVDEASLRRGLAALAVEYQPLPAVFDLPEAVQPGAPLLHRDHPGNVAVEKIISRGNLEKGWREAEVILEDTFVLNPVHQGYLEPTACVAVYSNGGVTLHTAVQSPHMAALVLAEALGMEPGDIRIVSPTMGGGFGGRVYGNLKVYLLSALLSKVTGRPVKLTLTREEEFIAGRPQAAAHYHIKIGARRDGLLVARQMDILCDNGAYAEQAPWVLKTIMERNDSLYRLPNLQTRGRLVYTNKIPSGQLRGYGNQMTNFVLESMMDRLARQLGLSPLQIRLVNCIGPGETSIHGYRIKSCALSECLRTAAEEIGLDGQMGQDGWGVGLSCAIHVNGNRGGYEPFDGSNCLLFMDRCGRVSLVTGEQDYGQGLNEVFAQLAAEVLTLPPESITIISKDTRVTPFAISAIGSRKTTVGGSAVVKAAQNMRRQLLLLASRYLSLPAERLHLEAGYAVADTGEKIAVTDIARRAVTARNGLPLCAEGIYYPPDTEIPDDRWYGNVSPTYSFAAHAARVQVDKETGQVRVDKVVAVHDSGRILNPLRSAGQVEGGVVQGMGFGLLESYLFHEGRVANPRLSGYLMPTAGDSPEVRAVFIETEDPVGPFGAKGLGEMAMIPTASALANAVFNATGVSLTSLPLTPEKIWRALNK